MRMCQLPMKVSKHGVANFNGLIMLGYMSKDLCLCYTRRKLNRVSGWVASGWSTGKETRVPSRTVRTSFWRLFPRQTWVSWLPPDYFLHFLQEITGTGFHRLDHVLPVFQPTVSRARKETQSNDPTRENQPLVSSFLIYQLIPEGRNMASFMLVVHYQYPLY